MDGEILVKDSSFNGTTIEFSIPVKTVTPKHYHSGEAEGQRLNAHRVGDR